MYDIHSSYCFWKTYGCFMALVVSPHVTHSTTMSVWLWRRSPIPLKIIEKGYDITTKEESFMRHGKLTIDAMVANKKFSYKYPPSGYLYFLCLSYFSLVLINVKARVAFHMSLECFFYWGSCPVTPLSVVVLGWNLILFHIGLFPQD